VCVGGGSGGGGGGGVQAFFGGQVLPGTACVCVCVCVAEGGGVEEGQQQVNGWQGPRGK